MVYQSLPLYRLTSSVRGLSLVARQKIEEGTIVLSFANLKPQMKRTYQTIEVGDGNHVVEEVLSKLNHSCNPTLIVDTENRECIAARDIEEGEELNFFYPSTESEMREPFECKCGASNCIKYVTGALSLPSMALMERSLNPHVIRILTATQVGHTLQFNRKIKSWSVVNR